ncbi:MAG: hypothetical protein L0H03_06590, partial [Rhodococcus sp. (in: high G+C Gram-positive bacteria)]|nr:hypothetical protein [Rhodococcus sp. (in: high G+C Gram-positive bacteria)]
VFGLAGVGGAVLLPIISDRLRIRVQFFLTAILILIPAYLCFAFVGSFPVLTVVAGIAGFMIMGVAPILFQHGSEVAYPAQEGTSLGVILLMGQISGILFVLAFSALNSASGGPTGPMLLIVAVTALVLPAVRRMRESGIGALPQDDVRRDGASA